MLDSLGTRRGSGARLDRHAAKPIELILDWAEGQFRELR